MYTIKDMSKTKFERYLRLEDACVESRQWCKGKTLKEAWSRTMRGDWMLWLLHDTKLAHPDIYTAAWESKKGYVWREGAKEIRKVVKVVQ